MQCPAGRLLWFASVELLMDRLWGFCSAWHGMVQIVANCGALAMFRRGVQMGLLNILR